MKKPKLEETKYRSWDGKQIRKAIDGDRGEYWLCARVHDGKLYRYKVAEIYTEEQWMKLKKLQPSKR